MGRARAFTQERVGLGEGLGEEEEGEEEEGWIRDWEGVWRDREKGRGGGYGRYADYM